MGARTLFIREGMSINNALDMPQYVGLCPFLSHTLGRKWIKERWLTYRKTLGPFEHP
jgi:hypothetical protein